MLEVFLFGLSRDRFEADQDRSTLSNKSAPTARLASPLSSLLQLLLPFSLSCHSPPLAAAPASFSERCSSDTATRLLCPQLCGSQPPLMAWKGSAAPPAHQGKEMPTQNHRITETQGLLVMNSLAIITKAISNFMYSR